MQASRGGKRSQRFIPISAMLGKRVFVFPTSGKETEHRSSQYFYMHGMCVCVCVRIGGECKKDRFCVKVQVSHRQTGKGEA